MVVSTEGGLAEEATAGKIQAVTARAQCTTAATVGFKNNVVAMVSSTKMTVMVMGVGMETE